jgi:seryl-tRNA synthetase
MNIAVKGTFESANSEDAIFGVLLRPMGVDGVYARTKLYEDTIEGLQRLITLYRASDAEVFRFPPVMSRRQLENSGYLSSFPQLLGCVCCLHGSEADILRAVDPSKNGGDWTSFASSADLVLSPAACYPVYPIAAERGPVPAHGLLFDVACDCFRHEPSRHLDRLQSFRMREYVRIGSPEQIIEFRRTWIERAEGIARQLGLSYNVDSASDPFFGRTGKLLALNQLEQALKFELLVPVRSSDEPTACMSFNYHRDYFAKTWNLMFESGETAHTGCVAFGLDRLAMALFAAHGLDPTAWPQPVREAWGAFAP